MDGRQKHSSWHIRANLWICQTLWRGGRQQRVPDRRLCSAEDDEVGACMVVVRLAENHWHLYGQKTGPCKAWRVSVSVSSVWFLVRVRYCKVPSCSWVLTIQESAGAIVVVQRPQHCAYDQAALEQLAEQLRQSLGIIPDEIPPSTPAPGTSSVSTLRPANQRVPLDVLTMVSLMWMRMLPCELHCYPPRTARSTACPWAS